MSEVFLRLILRIVLLGAGLFLVILFLPMILFILLILLVTGHMTVLRSRMNMFGRGRPSPPEESEPPETVSDGDTIEAEVIHAETVRTIDRK